MKEAHEGRPTKLVGIWIRVSSEEQAQGESPEHHERRAQLYAEAKGWKVREVYHLEAVSGKAVMSHPEAQRMLKDIKSGHITGLIFSKLARLARNTRELLDFADIFREYNADLISLQEAIDTTSPAGRLFYTMIAAMAQWEREEIGERVAASIPIRAKLGKPLNGSSVFGYQWKDKKLVPHPDEAPIRRRIYELFLKLRRVKSVARTLNEEGCRTRNGAEFTDTTVKNLIRDSTAKGLRRANYTSQNQNGKNWKLKPESEWIITTVDPIVPEELWNQCNALLDERSRTQTLRTRRPVHLFGGITFCGCGTKMHAKADKGKYVCPECRTKIPMDDLEAVFREQVQALVTSPEQIALYAAQADESLHHRQELKEQKEGECRTVAAEMEKLYRLYMDDGISVEDFRKRYRSLEERHRQIEVELPRLQAELDVLKIHYLSRDEVVSQAADLYSNWSKLPHEERRAIVEAIAEKIVVADDAIEINLCYLMPPEMAAIGQRGTAAASSPSSRIPTATRSS